MLRTPRRRLIAVTLVALTVGLTALLAASHTPTRATPASPPPSAVPPDPATPAAVTAAFTRARPDAPPPARVAIIDTDTALVTLELSEHRERVVTLRRRPDWQVTASVVVAIPPLLR